SCSHSGQSSFWFRDMLGLLPFRERSERNVKEQATPMELRSTDVACRNQRTGRHSLMFFFFLPPNLPPNPWNTRISVILPSSLVITRPKTPFSPILVNNSAFSPPSIVSPASTFLVSLLNLPLTTLTSSVAVSVISSPFSPFFRLVRVTLLPSTLEMD